MPNTLKTQSRKTALWNNRPVIVLFEDDGGDTYYHGVVIGPVGMSVAKALRTLDRVADRAIREAGEDWNYDDVLGAMKAAGFEEILAAEWWE